MYTYYVYINGYHIVDIHVQQAGDTSISYISSPS